MNNIVQRPRSQAGLLAMQLGLKPKIFRQRLRRLLGGRRLALGHTRCKAWAFSEADLKTIKGLFAPSRRQRRKPAPATPAPSAPAHAPSP